MPTHFHYKYSLLYSSLLLLGLQLSLKVVRILILLLSSSDGPSQYSLSPQVLKTESKLHKDKITSNQQIDNSNKERNCYG